MTVMERTPSGLVPTASASPSIPWDDCELYPEHFDPRTGEILTKRFYQSRAWEPYPEDDTRPFFETLTSLNQRDRFMQGIDKRKLVLFSGCRYIFDRDRGTSSLDNRLPILSKPVFRTIEKLVNLLDYQNYIYISADALAEKLEIHSKSVTRQLRSLGALVRVRSEREGMRKGVLRIAVSPAYGYRMEPESINESRYVSCDNWYRAKPRARYADRFELLEYRHGRSYPYYGKDEIVLCF